MSGVFNCNKTREAVQSGAQTLVFPLNFPDAWRLAGGGRGAEGEWHAVTDRALAHFGAEGTERWTALGPDPVGHRLDDIRRYQRPMRLGNRWDSLDDPLSLLADPMPNAPSADVLDPLDALFTQLGG